MKAIFFAAVLLVAGCSATSKSSRSPTAERPPDAPVDSLRAQPGRAVAVLPIEALELLTKSTTDSCSICARDLRTRAFRQLEERYPPGTILSGDPSIGFMRAPGDVNQWMIASDQPGAPRLTFRYHTAEDHLVGVAETDWTAPSVAERCRSIPEGTVFQAVLEVVPFAYGDGHAFLYHAPRNSVEIHCKILEISGH